MQISKEWLEEKRACQEGMSWFLRQKDRDGIKILKILIKIDKLQWANWLICRLMDKPNCIKYAIFSALEVIALYEKKYPDDKRPRKAIEAAMAWLDNPNETTQQAAYAAYAAAAAADAVYAAYAAAAADAVYAADADAAAYAANAAYAAADAVDAAYARKKLQIKILKYGLKLLSNGNKGDKMDDTYGSTFREELKHSMEYPAGHKGHINLDRRTRKLKRLWWDYKDDFGLAVVVAILLACGAGFWLFLNVVESFFR